MNIQIFVSRIFTYASAAVSQLKGLPGVSSVKPPREGSALCVRPSVVGGNRGFVFARSGQVRSGGWPGVGSANRLNRPNVIAHVLNVHFCTDAPLTPTLASATC
jgi:hypothetical protein